MSFLLISLIVLTIILPFSFSFFVSIFGIVMAKNRYIRILFIFIFAFVLGYCAYYFNPTSSFDLYRIYEKAEWLKLSTFSTFIKVYSGSTEFIFNLLFYIIIKNLDMHFVPAIFTFFGYFIIAYVITDYCSIKNTSKFLTLFVLVLFLFSFNHVLLISGIRNYFAFVIFTLLIYIEMIKKKENRLTNLLYIPLIFFHKSMIVYVFIRYLLFLNKKVSKTIVIIISLLMFVSPTVFLKIFENFTSNNIINSLYTGIVGYTGNNFHFYSFLIILPMYLFYVLCVNSTRYIIKFDLINEKFYRLFILLLIFGLGVIRYNVIFDRVLFLINCLSPIVFCDYFKQLSNNGKKYNYLFCGVIYLFVSLFLFRNQIHEYQQYFIDSFQMIKSNSFFNIVQGGGIYD